MVVVVIFWGEEGEGREGDKVCELEEEEERRDWGESRVGDMGGMRRVVV